MRASDVMAADVATVRADVPLLEATTPMEIRRVSGLPVVDAHGQLAGILNEGDLLRRVEIGTAGRPRAGWLDALLGSGREAADYVRTHGRRVEDLMTRDVATVTERTPIEDVVALREQRRVKRVPVVRDGQVVGVVSRADLLRLLGRALKAAAVGLASDAAIQGRVQADLQARRWLPACDVSIAVNDGVVTLAGIVGDEGTRAALRAAAQNTAGVAAAEDKLVWVDPVAADLAF